MRPRSAILRCFALLLAVCLIAEALWLHSVPKPHNVRGSQALARTTTHAAHLTGAAHVLAASPGTLKFIPAFYIYRLPFQGGALHPLTFTPARAAGRAPPQFRSL